VADSASHIPKQEVDKYRVLEEEVQHGVGDAVVVPVPVDEQQARQETESCHRKVGRLYVNMTCMAAGGRGSVQARRMYNNIDRGLQSLLPYLR
jgi:hypothetical protein